MPPDQIEAYKFQALRKIKEYGISHEAVWKTIAKDAGIPEEFNEAIRDILYEDGFIERTRIVKSMGHLIRGTSKINPFLLNYKSPDNLNSKTITVVGNHNQIAHGHLLDSEISFNAERSKSSDDKKSKTSIETWLKVAAAIIGLIAAIIGLYKVLL